MKGIIHSKRFKKSFGKWLFMYILCMGFFTTVVTYSKYISNMLNKDTARVSKFGVNLKYCADKSCEKELDIDKATNYLPYEEIVYYFGVDKSNLEVNSNLILTVSTDRHFKIKKVFKIIDGNEQEITSISKSGDKTFSMPESATVGDTKISVYKVIVEYDESVIDYNKEGCKEVGGDCKIKNGVITDESGLKRYIFNEKDPFRILSIGYSAVQVR